MGLLQEKAGVVCHNVDFDRSPYSVKNLKALFQLMSLMMKSRYSLVHVHTPRRCLFGEAGHKDHQHVAGFVHSPSLSFLQKRSSEELSFLQTHGEAGG